MNNGCTKLGFNVVADDWNSSGFKLIGPKRVTGNKNRDVVDK